MVGGSESQDGLQNEVNGEGLSLLVLQNPTLTRSLIMDCIMACQWDLNPLFLCLWFPWSPGRWGESICSLIPRI